MADNKVLKFGYDIALSFNVGKNATTIDSSRILSIVNNREYASNKIMPSIYLTLSVTTKLYKSIVDNKGVGKFVLKILKYRYNSNSTAKKNYIYYDFDYIVAVDPYSIGDETNENSEVKTNDYRKINVGLYMQDRIDKNFSVSINGIFKNTNLESLVHHYTSDLKILIEGFDDKTVHSIIAVPPISSISAFLRYLNYEISSFYKSKYMFFMDIDKAYLLSLKGKYTDAKDSSPETIKFVIEDLNSDNKESGMTIDKNMCIVHIDAANVDIKDNEANQIKLNSFSTISPLGAIRKVKISSGKKNRFIKLSHDNPNYINQLYDEINRNNTSLIITKSDIDSSIFTPNKEYNVIAKSSLKEINGKYQLISKREVFIQDSEKFICTVSMFLQKVSS